MYRYLPRPRSLRENLYLQSVHQYRRRLDPRQEAHRGGPGGLAEGAAALAHTAGEPPPTSRVCRIPLTSGTSFIDPESIKIAFRVRNTDATNPLAPATPNPACFIQRIQFFANGQRCDDTNYYGRTVAAHDLLKGREYNQNKAVEGFDEVNDSRTPRAVRQSGYADVLLRPTMVGILRCKKMLPPQLNLVIEIEFADATTALWSENAGAHPAGATLSTDFEIQNVRVLASQVVLDSALVESFNRVLLSGRSCSATPRCTRSSPRCLWEWRSTTSPCRAPSRNSWERS